MGVQLSKKSRLIHRNKVSPHQPEKIQEKKTNNTKEIPRNPQLLLEEEEKTAKKRDSPNNTKVSPQVNF